MNTEAKKQYMETLREKYFKADKKGKGKILDEYCENTGEDRKYAIKKFNYKVKIKDKEDYRKRKTKYNGEVVSQLVKLWKIFDYPCGQRLKPAIQTELPRLRDFGEISCSDTIAKQLLKISSSTIDRRLNHEKEVLKLKGKYRKKNSSFLLSTIPTKTGADFDKSMIGNVQIDFVESCGVSVAGEYVNNLSVVDIMSSWWEGEAVMGKGHRGALNALDLIRKRMPFDWLEMHPDNGPNLLNYAIYNYAQKSSISLSRSRAYHKNDNCFIEQKNSTHIRQVIGYFRYDTDREMDILNDLYRNELRDYKNFFQPVIKLKGKERIKGKVYRKYDIPQTPYQRLMKSNQVSFKTKRELKKRYDSLNPAELKRGIDKKLKELYKVYSKKRGVKYFKKANSFKKIKASMVSF
jgi:DNA-binding sugar fermentation-stimulating protein